MARKKKDEKERKSLQISEKNDLVSSVMHADYIKNPLLYAQMSGDFTIMQGKVMLSIIKQLQPQINRRVAAGELQGPSLFGEGDMAVSKDGLMRFEINLSDLGVGSNHYDKLEQQASELMTLHTSYREAGGYTMLNLFHKIHIPSQEEEYTLPDGTTAYRKRRNGKMLIEMHRESAEKVLTLVDGYVEHVGDIYDLCKSPRSARLYIYLSAWKDKRDHIFKASYPDLKEYLGVTEFDSDHRRIVRDNYPQYGVFRRDVLTKAKRELDQLAAEGQIDFSFDFEPEYPGTNKRGNPRYIVFTLIDGPKGTAYRSKKRLGRVQSELIKRYHLHAHQWEEVSRLMHPSMIEDLYTEMERIDRIIEQLQPDDVAAYVTRVLARWVEERSRQMTIDFGEAPDSPAADEPAQPKGPAIVLPDAEAQRQWKQFLLEVSQQVSTQDFETYFLFITLMGSSEDGQTVYVQCPTAFVAEQMVTKYKDAVDHAKAAVYGPTQIMEFLFD